jgi:ketosteroid isomerase-like protein
LLDQAAPVAVLRAEPGEQHADQGAQQGPEEREGNEQVGRSEQSDYDKAHWSIRSTPIDALQIAEDWVYGIAHVDATIVAHADGARTEAEATKTWLLRRQPTGEWLIARQMWNVKSKRP